MRSLKTIRCLTVSLLLVSAGAERAQAQSTWSGAGADQNWSTAGNWSGGAPGNTSTVTFPDGAFPITTNVQGVVNNIVQSSTTIASLTYNNQNANFDTTQIGAGTVLTVSGGLSVGANDAATVSTAVNFTGGGSLFAGTNGTSILTGQNGSGQGAVSVLDMSGLANFTFNAGATSPGAISLGTGSSGSSITVSLASVSNLLTASTLNIANNNTRGTVILNLGNGTNIIYADTINLGIGKTAGTMQFLNNAGGGLTIANHTGNGRATIHVSGEASTGGTTASNVGNMFLDGGAVNIMASTLTVGDRGNRAASSASPGAFGTLAFDNGVVDATTINMATNASGSTPATGTIAVSGTGILRIGAGGMNMVDQLAAQAAIGTLLITNGGSVYCSNNIYKGTSAGTANIVISGGSLTMASAGGTIGVSNSFPIDNLSLTNGVLTLPAAPGASVALVNFFPDATTQNTVHIPVLPSISAFPSQFQLITYQTAQGNLNSLALGTLPTGFGGYISNNVTTSSIDIVITSGPVAKTDQWGGAVNALWDTTTLNWTNANAAVNYNDFDFVTFNDQASSGAVTVTGTRLPASLSVNNSVLNYTFSGAGKISGATSLVKEGTATLTLSETGGDNFTGGIQINNGTVILDSANSAISGGVFINGGTTLQIGNNDALGTLPTGALDDEGTLVFKRSDNLQVGVNISGGGGLTQSGSGRLALSAANAFTGNTTVTAGTLALTNAGAIANSSSVGVTNATLDLSGVTTSASLIALTLSNSTLNLKLGYLQTNLSVGSVTMSGPSPNTINVRSLPPIAFYPSTNVLLQSASPAVGNNFVLGSLPAGSVGTIALSPDSTAVLLTLTSGPNGVRPTVTWSGADALSAINTNWSDAQNWVSPGTPVAGERVVFNDNGISGGSPFDTVGDGIGGIINAGSIDNIVDLNATNAGLNYANTSFHNTLIKTGNTLAVNGPLTVNGAGGTATILGAGGTLAMGNPANNSTLLVDAGNTPTLDLSGLDTFAGSVSQIGVGFNSGNTGSSVNGTLYLARTNSITTGGGFSGVGSALVIGGSTGTSAGAGTLYLGQTNALSVDGIVMGVSHSVGSLMAFNPVVTNNNPSVVIRGITGPSSRVTQWSIGDATVNLNNGAQGNGHVVDFSGGTLDALVANLNIGQGSQGNTALPNTSFSGMFNMGAGTLNVTSLKIGLSGGGAAGNGIGIMNVTGGNVVAGTLSLATTGGGQTNTSGALNLTNAMLTVSNNVTIGANTAGGTLSAVSSVIKLLNGASIGSPAAPLTILNLDGGSIQIDVDSGAGAPKIAAGTINTNNPTTINIHSLANIGNDPIQIPLITYTNGNDPYAALTLGSVPPGFTIGNGGQLVDNVVALSIDLIVSASTVSGPTTNANITRVSLSGTNLLVHGTNNNVPNTGFHYVVLTSTNLASPLSTWTPVATNSFNADGTFDYASPIVPGIPRQFIDVQAVP